MGEKQKEGPQQEYPVDDKIIVALLGGAGNQMFQYALFLSLKDAGKNVLLDDVSFLSRDSQRSSVLEQYFDLDLDRVPACALPYKEGVKKYYEKLKNFDEDVFNVKEGIVIGFWQNPCFFENEETIKKVRKAFACPAKISENPVFIEHEKMIRRQTSASMHIRRGDYLKNEELYGGICNDFYYENAMNAVQEKHPDIIFYIFSDDKEWAKKHYVADNIVVVDDPRLSDPDEFFLMSLCDHHILANSSFSWWATWLDDDPDAMIIAPEIWNTRDKVCGIYYYRMTIVPSGNGKIDTSGG